MVYSTSKEFDEAYQVVQDGFASGLTKDKEWRRRQLKRAWWMMEDNKDRIVQCLHEDLHKHRQESYITDCAAVQSDILDTLKNLDRWTADEKPSRTSLLNFLGNTTVRKEPLGVTLIIGAWNFPFCLLLQPMVAAIAAGCAMILKPSDNAPASQRLLMEIIPQYLDTNAIRAIRAGPQEMSYILDHRFDHIFYTGSANVAKIIHQAAAKNLTPVTLELGGQGPAIVTKSANINLAAKRIAATKFMNSGQICLNVNHVLVDPSVRDALTVELKKWFDTFRDGKTQPEYYTHIINERNFDRLDNLLQETSGQIIYGGERDRKTRFFAPTIVTGVKPGDSLLSEELFGPILPIIDADLDNAIAYTRAHEHPLVLYAFTNKEEEKARLLNETQSGGVTFNDCVLHVATHDTPFGGVGHSGLGYYHGHYGVLTFSHLRTTTNVLPGWMEMVMGARYAPYTLKKASTLAPPVSVSFDRNGNDTISYRGVVFKGLSIAALVSLAVMLKGPDAWDPLKTAGGYLNFSPGK